MAKNHFDVIYENNKLLNSGLADVTGEIYFNVSSAAAENAMKESEYLAATGGTRHDVYEDTAQKELAGQVSVAYKQAYNRYDLSKPTYGLSGRNLYGTGAQNSGYAKYAAKVNEDALKSNLSTIEQSKVAAQNEIAYSTEALKRQNQQAYAEYLSKYGTILDDYNRYFDKDEYTDAQIIAKLKKDGYTDDQIAAIPQLKTERAYEEKVSDPNYTFDRDALISDLGAGNVSPEFATIKLLENYGIGDAAKMAEDINAGRISQEAGEAWVDTVIASYGENGARVPYTYIDAWEENGLLTPEEALDYKRTVNKERADAAVTAFDSAANVDKFLKAWGGSDLVDQDGNPISDVAKSAYALQKVVDLVNTGVFESNGMGNDAAIKEIFSAYTEKVKNASETDAEAMLAAANAIYEKAKANGSPNQETLKDAVGRMYAKVSIDNVIDELSKNATDGFTTLANYAAAVLYGNEDAGSSDIRSIQEEYIKGYIQKNNIKVYKQHFSDYGRDSLTGKTTSRVGVAYYIEVNGYRVVVGANYDVGSNHRDFTSEQLTALEHFVGEFEELK